MSRRKNFKQSDWLIELSPRKNFEPRIVEIVLLFAARHSPPGRDPVLNGLKWTFTYFVIIFICETFDYWNAI